MAYDTENLKKNKGGSTLETSDVAPTPGGVYRHPETGIEVTTLSDPLYGDTQSEGFIRLGFVYVGPAPEGSIKSIVEMILDEKAKDNTVTGIADRLAKLEGVKENAAATEAENAELRKEIARLTANDTETIASGELAKANAIKVTEDRAAQDPTDANSGVTTGDAATDAPETPATALTQATQGKDVVAKKETKTKKETK